MVDVAVIGGGLAGCCAALHLQQQGLRVTLFEARRYPHHKVCGEFLSPECVDLFEELGFLPRLRALNPTSIKTVSITAKQTSWETYLPGLGISRYVLDHALVNYARASDIEVREETTVTAVHGNLESGFQLTVRMVSGIDRIRARTVIAAHGKRSSLDRVLNRAFLRQPQPFVGLKRHFYGASLPGRLELYAFPGGYCGLSEIEGDKANVCLLVRQEIFQRVGQGRIPTFIAWLQRQNERLGDWLSSACPVMPQWLSISQVPFVDKSVLENDILMVGDAAGLIAPLTGDGMAMALQGGSLAALAIGPFLAGHWSADQLRQRYLSDWRRVFYGRLRLARLLQALMLRPHLLSIGLRAVMMLPPLGHFLLTHTRDLHPETMRRTA